MTPYVRQWMEEVREKFLPNGVSVLEVGSLDINGGVRDLFDDCTYCGIDLREGPGVDLVMNAMDLTSRFGLESQDVVLCLETLEHVERFWFVLNEMWNVLRMGGWFVLTVPDFSFPIHKEPKDYWRFGEDTLPILMSGFEVKRRSKTDTGFGQAGVKV